MGLNVTRYGHGIRKFQTNRMQGHDFVYGFLFMCMSNIIGKKLKSKPIGNDKLFLKKTERIRTQRPEINKLKSNNGSTQRSRNPVVKLAIFFTCS